MALLDLPRPRGRGLLVLAAFCLQQRHEIARGRQPLLDLRLLTRRSLASGLVVQFLFLVRSWGSS